MFPLAHHYINKQLLGSVPKATILGSLWPDLAAAGGCDRNAAHACGSQMLAWSMPKGRFARDLALGVASHGIDPHCVDWYADEFWPGYCKGWCFLQGEQYLAEVKAATQLTGDTILPQPPTADIRNYVWWKSHNFVEMSYELWLEDAQPEMKEEIIAAVRDEAAIAEAALLLAQFHNGQQAQIAEAFRRVPQIYSLLTVTPEDLAEKQCRAFCYRFGHSDGDPAAMAALLRRMKVELAPTCLPFLHFLLEKARAALCAYLP